MSSDWKLRCARRFVSSVQSLNRRKQSSLAVCCQCHVSCPLNSNIFVFFFPPVFSHHVGSPLWLMIFLLHVALSVHLLARSQPGTFHVEKIVGTRLSILFPVIVSSVSLVMWYIHPQHIQYVFFISPHPMPIPVQSSLRDPFGSSRMCSYLILSLRITLRIHRSLVLS